MNPRIASLEKLIDGPRDGALLRFSLGNEYLKSGDAALAATAFRSAVEHDPSYSAAWKALGKALAASGDHASALVAYEQGISVAEKRGDIQAVKEMKIFLRRLNQS